MENDRSRERVGDLVDECDDNLGLAGTIDTSSSGEDALYERLSVFVLDGNDVCVDLSTEHVGHAVLRAYHELVMDG